MNILAIDLSRFLTATWQVGEKLKERLPSPMHESSSRLTTARDFSKILQFFETYWSRHSCVLKVSIFFEIFSLKILNNILRKIYWPLPPKAADITQFRRIAEIFEKSRVVVSREELLQRNAWGLVTSPSIPSLTRQNGGQKPWQGLLQMFCELTRSLKTPVVNLISAPQVRPRDFVMVSWWHWFPGGGGGRTQL